MSNTTKTAVQLQANNYTLEQIKKAFEAGRMQQYCNHDERITVDEYVKGLEEVEATPLPTPPPNYVIDTIWSSLCKHTVETGQPHGACFPAHSVLKALAYVAEHCSAQPNLLPSAWESDLEKAAHYAADEADDSWRAQSGLRNI